ncbi:MAG: DinB family protein [Bacteroidota bacterium]
MGKRYTLDFFTQSFNTGKKTIETLFNDMEEEVFQASIQEGKWSSGEILDHINISSQLYLNQMHLGLPEDQLSSLPKGPPPFRISPYWRLFIYIVSPENTFKTPTFPSFEPREASLLQKEELITKALYIQDEFLNIVETAREHELNLARVPMRNPEFNWLKMNVNVGLAIIEAHQRRHFLQIQAIKDSRTS